MLKKVLFIVFSLFFLLHPLFSQGGEAHTPQREPAPLVKGISQVLALAENGRGPEALRQGRLIYEDFQDPGRNVREEGMKRNAERIDKRYDTTLATEIARAFGEGDMDGLRKGLYTLSLLLMLEKYDILQATLAQRNINPDAQITIFELGSSFFHTVFEPPLKKRDPIEWRCLDVLLDKILFALEFKLGKEEFIKSKEKFVKGIMGAFEFTLPKELSKIPLFQAGQKCSS